MVEIVSDPDRIVICSRLKTIPVSCPGCGMPSRAYHGHYDRVVADPPWQGKPVCLRIRLRRFACQNLSCGRRTFSEPVQALARPFARRSERLREVQRHLGLALGGEAAERLSHRLGMRTSADTLLRLVRAGVPAAATAAPRVVGIDEWAWRRGRRYGTMIVDLERNEIIDLLPDRDAKTLAAWLKERPTIEVIARDRAEVFAEGIRGGAPGARQVVDRWHLLCNVSAVFQVAVSAHHRQIKEIADAVRTAERQAAHRDSVTRRMPTAAERESQARHAPRAEKYAEMMLLLAAGTSQAAVSRTLGLDRKTVRRWIRQSGPPRWRKPKRAKAIDPYRAYLEQRWQEGCRNGAELGRELARQGADIRPRIVRDWATCRRREGADRLDAEQGPNGRRWRPPSTNRTTRLLQCDPGKLAGEDRRFVDDIRQEIPELSAVVELIGRLTRLLRCQSDESLLDWFKDAAGTPLARFAATLSRDADAVAAAIELPWTTSPVEGQISRLKMVKRTMYGRAGFDLLRQRVLAPT
ncbi:ISL3 family transposase [Jiella sonneratiae]|uniref:ISL3 family transposase n=1 Tax=Jiella sonneratiae TaxID=2816856 RepID=A0ABS3J647_9HYPH|nr:ISL3 family transposase [Jiella sonneratiae]